MTTPTTTAQTKTAPTTTALTKTAAGLTFVLSGLAVYAAVYGGVTEGGNSMFSDEAGVRLPMLFSGLLHGTTYAVLAALLWVERARIDAGSIIRSVLRSGFMASYAMLAIYFIPVSPYLFLTNGDSLTLDGVVTLPANLGFAGMFLFAAPLGLAMLKLRYQRVASALLIGILPSIGLMYVVAAVAPDYAHPAYLEVLVYLGTVLACTATPHTGSTDTPR